MKRAFREFFISIFLLAIIIVTGCGSENTTIKNDLLSGEQGESTHYYSMESRDLGITSDYQPASTSFVLTDNALFIYDVKQKKFFETKMESEASLKELAVNVEGASIQAYTIDDKNTVYCIGQHDGGFHFFAAYLKSGEQLWKKEFDAKESEIFKLIRDENGNFYALSTEYVFLFDENGVYMGEIACPEKSFCDISKTKSKDIYVSFYGENDNAIVIAKVDNTYKKLIEESVFTGNGFLCQGQADTLLLSDGKGLFSFRPDTQVVEKLISYADYNIDSGKIQTALQKDDGNIVLISWELLNQGAPVEMIIFSESDKPIPAEDDKQIITMLCLQADADEEFGYGKIVSDFNRQSEKYRVVFETVPVTDSIYSSFHARLTKKESADLLVVNDYIELEKYQKQGYLEDLTPYIEKSENISKDDYLQKILNCYMINEKLYGMGQTFSIRTLNGRASELGNTPGWTVEEYLTWLKENPDAKGYIISKEIVLEYILKGMDVAGIDFEGAEFKSILEKISQLPLEEEIHITDWYEVLESGNPILQETTLGYFGDISSTESDYQDQVVYKGYPNTEGVPKYYVYTNDLISILSKSECKEGAYAFLEYYLLHPCLSEITYYTKREDFESGIEYASDNYYTILTEELTEEKVPMLTSEQKEQQLEIIELAIPDTLDNQTIRSIVVEEAGGYFAGDKTLEDICHIIDNRVQLYLDENY